MAIYPDDFLRYAKKLNNMLIMDEEIHPRTIINRAYFGVFLKARKYAGQEKPGVKKWTHTRVVVHFEEKDKILGGELRFLMNERIKSDYLFNSVVRMADAQSCYRRAILVSTAIDRLPKPVKKSKNSDQ